MNLSSPLERPRRGLSVVFVRYDRAKYARAWDGFSGHLRAIAPSSTEVVIVDNADPSRPSEPLEERVHVIGGSNRAWEFSAFDEGVEWLRSQGRLHDVTLLATDAFAAYGGDFVDLVDETTLRFCRRSAVAIGWVDSFEEPCSLFESPYEDWLRTSYLILPSVALAEVGPFAWPMPDQELFHPDWRARWQPAAPLSSALRSRVDYWLTGMAEGDMPAEADTWHSRFDLDAETFPFFKAKARAILREHHLSIRLRAARIPIFDLRVVADRLARGGPGLLSTADEGLDGLRALRSRNLAAGAAEPAALPGLRFVFAGDLRRAADVAAARRFSTQVMPLVLQRFPAATFELPSASPDTPVSGLAGANNTWVTSPDRLARERPDVMAAIVVPALEDGTAAPAPPLDAASWENLERIEVGASPVQATAGWPEAVAVAGRCCAVLEVGAGATSTAEALAAFGEDAADRAGSTEEAIAPEVFETVAHRWRAEYRSWRQGKGTEFDSREAHERSLVEGAAPFLVQGLCFCCGRETPLHVDFEFGGDPLAARPNWRERLVCQVCGLNSKMRGLFHVLMEVVVPRPDPRVLVWELKEELTGVLRSKFDDVTTVAGGTGLPEALREPPYDCVLAVDMFEREPDLGEAIERSLAYLRPGGGMVFTAAFLSDRERNRPLAGAEPGEARREFGWSMLQAFREGGFEDVVAHFFWSRAFGYLGREQVVFVARKPGRRGSS